MTVMPVRFKRATAPFDETARARLCESSGSEHSAGEASPELADLVDSFIQTTNVDVDGEFDEESENEDSGKKKGRSESGYDSDTVQTLEGLLRCRGAVSARILAEADKAYRKIGNGDGLKRRLMSELRQRGFDAGLCKSRWEKRGSYPAGEYEYIDVVAEDGGGSDKRYIIEINLAGAFEIARPSARFLALLALFPPIFVGKPETLKRVITLMCVAAKESLKGGNLHLPPWRRNGYVQAKWFGTYKRTTNPTPATAGSASGMAFAGKKDVGFMGAANTVRAAAGAGGGRCRGDLAMQGRGGYLTMIFNGMDL